MRMQDSKIAKTEASCWPGSVRAERYDIEINRVFYRGILARLLDQVPSLAGRGLDLGCGSGFSTQFLIEKAPHVTWSGVDCSREMVQLALGKPGLGDADLRVARAEALPFADGSFDTVVANFSWHWFGDEARHEIRRVLRPRGWLLASVPLRRFSSAPGNRALARALLAGRRHYAARASQGLRFEDVPRLLPGKGARDTTRAGGSARAVRRRARAFRGAREPGRAGGHLRRASADGHRSARASRLRMALRHAARAGLIGRTLTHSVDSLQ